MHVRLLSILLVGSTSYASQFEGVLGAPVDQIRNMNALAAGFVPYNPVVIEIGAYEGEGTRGLSKTFPYGRVIAFEAHPAAYEKLAINTQSVKNVLVVNMAIAATEGTAQLCGSDSRASLVCIDDEALRVNVDTMSLDKWCERNHIDHIDFLRLDAGGIEWQILQSSPKMLSHVLVIVTKTHMFPSQNTIVSFRLLRALLEDQGFELLSHWYEDGKEGEATFVRKYMYESIFR